MSGVLDLARWGGRPAVISDGGSVSFAELDVLSRRWATALEARPGTSVAALMHPGLDAIAAMLGTYRCGATWVPINPRYRRQEIEHVLRDSGATRLIHDPELHSEIPTVQGVTEVPTPDAAAFPPAPSLPIDAEAIALLIYTSGTTGRSKGVELSHGAVARGIGALVDLWQWTDRDVLSLQLPLFHVHGLCIGVHGALLRGVTMLVHRGFEPERVVADFASRGATIFMGVPTMYVRLLDVADVEPLREARLFTAGSAALPADDFRRFEARTGHAVLERYGMTETLITLSNPHDGERRPGSVGRPLPGAQIRIVDDDGTLVPDGDAGELQVQTPGMMTRYRGRPDDTAAAFDGPWFKTGDVVIREPDGYVRIVGRRSTDIIKSGGFKIGAREIEDVLAAHPNVIEVAVFGVPDREWGERIAAAVVLAAPAADALAVLQALCRSKLADYKTPRQLVVLDALPRNAMGKVLKAKLQRIACADEETPRSPSG